MKLLDKLKEKIFTRHLQHLAHPKHIKNYLTGQHITRSPNCTDIDLSNVTVAAVQMQLRLATHPVDYAAQMLQKVRLAVHQGAQLVVFPENNTLQLVGLLPGVTELAPKGAAGAGLQSPGGQFSFFDIFSFLSPFAHQIYLTTFAELARVFGIYLLGGSLHVRGAAGRLLNRAYLFDPQGQIIGQQDKTHLLPLEATWGLSCGETIHTYATPLGQLALPVCMDATYFETTRLLALQGADIVMLPVANPEQAHYWKALRGIWPRVQESYLYGVKSTLVCQDFFGFVLTGQAGIYAPLELTEKGDGVIAEAATWDQEEIVTAALDIPALRRARNESEYYGRWNRELYRSYFPALYGAEP